MDIRRQVWVLVLSIHIKAWKRLLKQLLWLAVPSELASEAKVREGLGSVTFALFAAQHLPDSS